MLFAFCVCVCVKKRPGMLCTRSEGPVMYGPLGRARAAVSEVINEHVHATHIHTPLPFAQVPSAFPPFDGGVCCERMVCVVSDVLFASHEFRRQSSRSGLCRRWPNRLPFFSCAAEPEVACTFSLGTTIQHTQIGVSVINVVLMPV